MPGNINQSFISTMRRFAKRACIFSLKKTKPDPELLALTGGIIQGMSGAPIIQNRHLIGAVTHVLVQDASRGYGIFIENMLEH